MIGAFQLPWLVIAVAMALAVLATFFAASRPARSITRLPIVTALSGRPAPPKQVHRSALPGVVLLVVAAVLFAYAGKSNGNGSGCTELVLGLVALIAAVILLSPLFLAAWPGWAGEPRSRSAWPCATWPATGPARARRSPPSASAC